MAESDKVAARIKITVKPRSSRNAVEAVGDSLIVRVTAPPVEGKANEMCLALVGEWLGVPKSRLSIISGATQRHKVIAVSGLAQSDLDRRLRSASGPTTPPLPF